MNFQRTEISHSLHQLPGIGTITYLYDPDLKSMTIMIDRTIVKSYTGSEATDLKRQVIGTSTDYDEFEKKIDAATRKAWYYSLEQLRLRTRKREIVERRQIVMHWLMTSLKYKDEVVGGFMGGYDRCTVLHAVTHIDNLLDRDKVIIDLYDDFKKNI